jgi:phage gpG-like protein
MPVNVALNKATSDAFKAKLKAAREKLNDNGVAMKQIAVMLDSWVQRNFQGKGGNVGGWEPYKYGGRLVRKSKSNGKSIEGHKYINGSAVMLQDTGALRHSFLPFIAKGTAGIGSDLPYSKPHEDGDSRHGLPQRRMLPKNADVDVQVHQILDNYILGIVKFAND